MRKNNSLFVSKTTTYKGHLHSVYALHPSLNPKHFYSGGGDRNVVEWEINNPESGKIVAKSTSTIYSISKIQDQGLLLIGQGLGGLHVIDVELKKEIHYLKLHESGIFNLKFDKNLHRCFASSADGSISVWDTINWQLIRHIKISDEKIRSISLSQELNLIAIACSDSFIYILKYDSLEPFLKFKAHSWGANVVNWHPNGKWLISASKDAHIRVWDATDNFNMILNIPAHNYAIYAIDFDPENQWMASASRDKTIKIWEADTLDFLLRIDKKDTDGHTHSVNTLLWLNEENMLLSGGDDRSILTWKINV